MRGVESVDEAVIHAVSSRRDQDIVRKDVARHVVIASHEHGPIKHDAKQEDAKLIQMEKKGSISDASPA